MVVVCDNMVNETKCASCRNKNRACDCCTPDNTNYEEKSEFRAIFGVQMSAREVALKKETTDRAFSESIAAIQRCEINNMNNMGRALSRPELTKAAIEEYKEQQGI